MTAPGAKQHDKTGRSVGRRKTNARTKIGGQFAPRLIGMLNSPPYRVLTKSEHLCLSRIEIELAYHGGADNGRLPVTFDNFEEYGVHRHSIAPSIRVLAALGFIEVTEEGRAGNAEWRRPTLFRLTYRNSKSMEPTNEWARVETMHEAETIARAARRASKKQNPSGGKRTMGQCGKRTTNRQIHSAETATTGHSAETATTLYISEGQRRARLHRDRNEDAPRSFAVVNGGVVARVGVRVAKGVPGASLHDDDLTSPGARGEAARRLRDLEDQVTALNGHQPTDDQLAALLFGQEEAWGIAESYPGDHLSTWAQRVANDIDQLARNAA